MKLVKSRAIYLLRRSQTMKILDLEYQLYKAKDHCATLKKKCEEKTIQILDLKSKISNLEKQIKKKNIESTDEGTLSVCIILGFHLNSIKLDISYILRLF